jgi:hypothetical protein
MNINEDYKEKFGEKEVRRITEICLNALKWFSKKWMNFHSLKV